MGVLARELLSVSWSLSVDSVDRYSLRAPFHMKLSQNIIISAFFASACVVTNPLAGL